MTHITKYFAFIILQATCFTVLNAEQDKIEPKAEQKIVSDLHFAKEAIFDIERFFSKEDQGKNASPKGEVEPSPKSEDLQTGRDLAKAGEWEKAKQFFLKHILEDPKDLRMHLALATLYIQMGLFKECLDLFEDVRNKFKELPEQDQKLVFYYRYLLAIVQLKVGRTDQGRETLVYLLKEDIKFKEAYSALAISYLQDHKEERAYFIISRGIDICGEEPEFLNLLGVIKYRQSDLQKAQFWYDQALNKNPLFVSASLNKIILQIITMPEKDSGKELLDLLKQHPWHYGIYQLLGLNAFLHNDYLLARNYFEKSLDLNKNDVVSRFLLAKMIREIWKDEKLAKRLWQEVARVASATSEIYQQARSYLDDLQ